MTSTGEAPIVTLTMNPALDITTDAESCALPRRSAAVLFVTTPAAAASTSRRWPTT